MQIIKQILLLCALATAATGAWSQVQQARGKATVTYAGAAASADDKNKAANAARLKAIEFYYAEAGETESQNFDGARDTIAANLDRHILETTVLAEQDEPSKKQYTVTVKVSLNVASLRNALKSNSAVAQSAPQSRSALAFMFVSREVASTRTFDDRVFSQSVEKAAVEGNSAVSEKGVEGESVRKGQVSTNASTSQLVSAAAQRTVSKETGGSTTRRAGESTYRLIPSSNLSQVFTASFTRAGFKVNEASMVEPYTGGHFTVASVENDYKSGADLKPATLNSMVSGMRVAQIPFVALGTLDVGLSTDDPNTGLKRVAVTVNAKLLNISEAIPSTVASVGPVQYAATGPTAEEAQGNALRLAANNAARELTSQLNSIGIR
jgi:hypothetical protein